MSDTDRNALNPQCSNAGDYCSNAENKIGEWQRQIDVLKLKGTELVGDAKKEFDALMGDLEDNQTSFKAYLSGLTEKAEDTWEDIKDEAQEKWTAFSDTVEKAISRYT
jgi:hypothetical protein